MVLLWWQSSSWPFLATELFPLSSPTSATDETSPTTAPSPGSLPPVGGALSPSPSSCASPPMRTTANKQTLSYKVRMAATNP